MFKLGIKDFSKLSRFSYNNSFLNSFVDIRRKINFFKQLKYTHTLSNVADKNNSDLHNNTNKLNPWFVTGFTDGEGCFMINLRPNSKLKTGYSVELVFKIALHSKDKPLVENLKNFFGVGTVTARGSDCIQYWVGSLKDLHVIVDHFENYPLISDKWSDYQLFKQVVDLMKGREHLTMEGLQKIVSIKAVLNKGLPENLKAAFSNVVPTIRPKVYNKLIPNPYWISGFVSGEGCFFFIIKNSSKGGSVGFRFLVTQHIRDAELLKNLVNYLGCGKYYIRPLRPLYGDYLVTKLNDIKDKIIPFFDKYPIQGVKFFDFSDLKKVMLLREKNNSLTKEGLDKIKQIQSGMNKGRIRESSESSLPHSLDFTGSNNKDKKTLVCSNYRSFSKVSLTSQENKRHYSSISPIINKEDLKSDQIKFNQWLAGFIDGEGQFNTTKKGNSSLKIVMHINERPLLYLLKHRYGGSIKEIAGSNALKYKLSNPKGLINLINDVNGLLRNPIRMLQLNRICEKYNINLLEPIPLTYNNGWLSGFIDSDGSIYIDEKSGQLIISVTQKNKYLLDPLQKLYSGRVEILSPKTDAFRYVIYRKSEILKLIDVYFSINPLKSNKKYKINLIKDFYYYINFSKFNKNTDKFNQWIQFKNKWDKIV